MSQQDPPRPAPLDALQGVGPLARRLNQMHTRLWYEHVDRDLTGPQFTVLALLDAHGDMDQGTLGALAYLDKSTAAPLLERLHRRGLVDMARDTTDRRRKLVHVTDKGRKLPVRLAPAAVAVSEQILAVFSAEEHDQLLDMLRRAVDEPT
jgi:DNA-binding MarR family transcriptional regulator